MKIGIVASEFPPAVGGMEQHAHGLVTALEKLCQLQVFIDKRYANQSYQISSEIIPILSKDVFRDWEKIRENRFDVILTLNAGYAPIASCSRIPVFCYCHGNDFLLPWIDSLPRRQAQIVKSMKRSPALWRLSPTVDAFLSKKQIIGGLKCAKHIFVNSEFTKRRLVSFCNSGDENISIVHPGVSDDFFSLPVRNFDHQRDQNPDRGFNFLTVARLSSLARKKNVDGILRAFSILRDSVPFQLNIVGDGDLRPSLEELSWDLGLSERVNFLGSVEKQEVISLLDNTDLFILPSKAMGGDVEGFGIVYVEAAARGVPALASHEGGSIDAVLDGVTGILVANSSPEEIAKGISRFVNGKSKFSQLAIIEHAQKFKWDRIASDIYRVLRA